MYLKPPAPVQGSGIERLRLIMIPSQLDLPRIVPHLSAPTKKERDKKKRNRHNSVTTLN